MNSRFNCVIQRLVRVTRWNSVRFNSLSVLKPFLDIEERLGDRRRDLMDSVKLRGSTVSVSDVESCWTEYKDLVARMNSVDESRNRISRNINESMGKGGDDVVKDNLEHLKVTAKLLREDFKHLKSAVQKYENVIFPLIFELPNDLHPSVGLKESVIFENVGSKKNPKSKHHLTIGNEQDLIDFLSPTSYFLKNDAALFELESGSRFKNSLQKSFDMISCPGFSRTIVIDGCQGSNDPFLFALKKSPDDADNLYLNGTATVYPFLSYLAKQSLQRHVLPWRYFTLGRHYCNRSAEDLFSANQSDAVHLFIGCSRESVDGEFDDALNAVKDIYLSFGLPFRIINVSAVDLYRAESRRVSFQVYSTHSEQYVEIGYMSLYGDYLSKRMTSKYTLEGAHFLNCLSGTIVRITPFLACYLEHANNCRLH